MKRLLLLYVSFALYISCYSQTTISNDYLGELCRISVNLSSDEITDGYFGMWNNVQLYSCRQL